MQPPLVFWCFVYHLELAIANALKGTLFTKIDEMLLRVYYLYEKSPKKCNEIDDIITALRSCLELGDLSNKGCKPTIVGLWNKMGESQSISNWQVSGLVWGWGSVSNVERHFQVLQF